ncbi:hypothetical protein ABZS29_08105 [Kribbella sp. NPDC005582]|uniref:hypothetical protein n=1 Tax=Kribbella sp. NPDC005582 TaxID=3156893 RepID=UPI0033A06DDC
MKLKPWETVFTVVCAAVGIIAFVILLIRGEGLTDNLSVVLFLMTIVLLAVPITIVIGSRIGLIAARLISGDRHK